MRTQKIAAVVALLILVGVSGYFHFRGMKDVASENLGPDGSGIAIKTEPGLPANPMVRFLAAYRTSIEFYGKVVDQHGEPIEGATVTLAPFDNPHEDDEDGSQNLTVMSDKEGRFSVNGLRGAALAVWVEKDGYLTYPDLGPDKKTSSRLIEYGLDGTGGARFKDPANPTLFMLHKVGPVDPIAYVKRRWKLPVNGNPVRIALDSEDGRGTHQIEFRFTSGWNQLPMDNEINKKRFDWKLEARIPGGGFLPNDSDYNFEAPEGGYEESIGMEYSASMSREEWKATGFRRCFVKFADGSYGRIRFSIDGGSDRRPLEMTSWLNLKPGSRNLASEQRDPTVVSE